MNFQYIALWLPQFFDSTQFHFLVSVHVCCSYFIYISCVRLIYFLLPFLISIGKYTVYQVDVFKQNNGKITQQAYIHWVVDFSQHSNVGKKSLANQSTLYLCPTYIFPLHLNVNSTWNLLSDLFELDVGNRSTKYDEYLRKLNFRFFQIYKLLKDFFGYKINHFLFNY